MWYAEHAVSVVIPGLLSLLDLLPEAVHRVCDLINVITLRNGEKWRRNILNALTVEVRMCRE